jgi:hypothetical protein
MKWKVNKLALLCLGVLFAAASSARAWNATGHEVVAEIAWQNLKPEVRDKISTLLKAHPHYKRYLTSIDDDAKSPEEPLRIFMRAAIWPDLVRSGRNSKDGEFHHGDWHFIDYPLVLEGVDRSALEIPKIDEKLEAGKDPHNVVQALDWSVQKLKDTKATPAERAVALAWLEHLVGDIHQPLHACSLYSAVYPKGDRGGNLFMVKFHGVVTNLHLFWDERLGGYMSFKLVDSVASKAADGHPRASFEKELAVKSFSDWAAESFALARDVVYAGGKLAGVTREVSIADKAATTPELPEKYDETSRQTARTRAALAGYRLADLLNQIFGDK